MQFMRQVRNLTCFRRLVLFVRWTRYKNNLKQLVLWVRVQHEGAIFGVKLMQLGNYDYVSNGDTKLFPFFNVLLKKKKCPNSSR